MTKEELLQYKHTRRNPNKTHADIEAAYKTVKDIIDENVHEAYIRNIFYNRFLKLQSWVTIGCLCGNLTDECVRKIVERYIKKTQK